MQNKKSSLYNSSTQMKSKTVVLFEEKMKLLKKLSKAVVFMFILNIIVTGLLQSRIKTIGNKINTVENSYAAQHTIHSYLFREKQHLMRRDRIVSYAQQNLGMIPIKPDEIASGRYIKEIKEDSDKNNLPVYSFIDFITPTLHAFEIKP